MVAGSSLLRLDPPPTRKALGPMNLPQVFPSFHLRQLERRPFLHRAGSFILRRFQIHEGTLPNASFRSRPFCMPGIFFVCMWHIFRGIFFRIRGIFIWIERLKCGTAGREHPERSELAALSAVATTDLFSILISECRVPFSQLLL